VAADRALLRALIAVLHDGLRIFEARGPATAERGGAELLAIVRQVHGRYAAYLDDARALLPP